VAAPPGVAADAPRAGAGSPLGQFLRFGVVGGAAALLFVAVATLLRELGGLAYEAASLLSYLACIPVAFLAQRRFAFRSSVPLASGLVRYALVQALMAAITALVSGLLGRLGAGWPSWTVFAVAAVVNAVCSFALMRWLVFRAPRG